MQTLRIGDTWPGDTRTQEEQEEWKQLHERLEELTREDDKSYGVSSDDLNPD